MKVTWCWDGNGNLHRITFFLYYLLFHKKIIDSSGSHANFENMLWWVFQRPQISLVLRIRATLIDSCEIFFPNCTWNHAITFAKRNWREQRHPVLRFSKHIKENLSSHKRGKILKSFKSQSFYHVINLVFDLIDTLNIGSIISQRFLKCWKIEI